MIYVTINQDNVKEIREAALEEVPDGAVEITEEQRDEILKQTQADNLKILEA